MLQESSHVVQIYKLFKKMQAAKDKRVDRDETLGQM